MSTKIFHVYRTKLDIYEILEVCKKIKPETNKLIKEQYLEPVTRAIVSSMDVKATLTDEDVNATSEIKELKKQELFDASCSIVVYPCINKFKETKSLFKIFGGSKEVHDKIVTALSGVDFHYQNQVDQPEDVTAKEWNKRIEIWDAVLPNGSFLDNGLSYDFQRESHLSDFEILRAVRKHDLDDGERKKSIFLEIRMNEALKKHKEDTGKTISMSDYMRLRAEQVKGIESGKYDADINNVELIEIK